MLPPSEIPRSPQSTPEEPTNSEVAGMFDAFLNLEEIAPDLNWTDVIADSWGVPVEVNSETPKVLEP
jgi:hypothetical protein